MLSKLFSQLCLLHPTTPVLKRIPFGILIVLTLFLTQACHDHDDYGPYWTHSELTPTFTAKQDTVSTSFTGRVYPETLFILGKEDGFSFTKPNARLTINANTVWAYAPVIVSLYDGEYEEIGSDATLITRWEVVEPYLDDSIDFVDSQYLNGRIPLWVVVEFIDFSGICILEVLGHD